MRTSSECNRKYDRDQHYFDKIDTPNKAYILGLLYADGNNHSKHNSITLSLQEEDKELLEQIRSELKYEGPLRFTPLNKKNLKHKNAYVLCINDEYLSHQLIHWGVVDNKSLILTFPQFLPDDLISHFVRGYFDGDGCIYYDNKRNKCQTQTCSTYEFCQELSNLLLHFNCKNSIKHPKQCHNKTAILQTSENKSSYYFLSWIYDNAEMKLERKYNQYLSFLHVYKSI